jgi:hypothetical protein
MQRVGLDPDCRTFKALLSACADHRHCSESEQLATALFTQVSGVNGRPPDGGSD